MYLTIEDKLLRAALLGDEENPPIIPRYVNVEKQEKWEDAVKRVKAMEDKGWLEIISIEDGTRETMEIYVQWLLKDDRMDAKEIADFTALFDKIGLGGDDCWIFAIDVYL